MKDIQIFADSIEPSAQVTIDAIASSPWFDGVPIRIMPDAHNGNGIVIGFTAPMTDHVNPEHIGADIGCGIEVELFTKSIDPDKLPLFEQRVRNVIPMGKELNKNRVFDLKEFCRFLRRAQDRAAQWSDGLTTPIPFKDEDDISQWCRSLNVDEKTFYKSIGTLGGGNHFIELDVCDETGTVAATVHTGSRNIGQRVCRKWAKKAIPTGGYLSGALLSAYLSDMVVCQAYAQFNRQVILQSIADVYAKLTKGKVSEVISSVHNYIDFQDNMIRKGAIRSYDGEKLVIPFNMRDGLAICLGKSNPDWNFSAPHGAGRAMSRSAAQTSLSMESFLEAMQGVCSTSVCPQTLDESPMAYKDTGSIIQAISPTCSILHRLRPLVNIKDTGDTDR